MHRKRAAHLFCQNSNYIADALRCPPWYATIRACSKFEFHCWLYPPFHIRHNTCLFDFEWPRLETELKSSRRFHDCAVRYRTVLYRKHEEKILKSVFGVTGGRTWDLCDIGIWEFQNEYSHRIPTAFYFCSSCVRVISLGFGNLGIWERFLRPFYTNIYAYDPE